MRFAPTFVRTALAVFALVFASATALADAPFKPVEFGARQIDGNSAGGMVKLSWMANREGDAPEFFDVYMATGETEDMAQFNKIGAVQVTPNTPLDKMFFYVVEDLQPGTYTFFIKAVNGDGESPRSIIKVITLADPSQPKIDIVSQPSNTGVAGKPYTYNVKIAKNFDGGTATYEIVHGPDGMTINGEGELVWPEAKAGRYEIKIKVSVEINGVVLVEDQAWVIEIKEGDDHPDACVTIYGSVKGGNATNDFPHGVVTAWVMKQVTNDQGEIVEKFVPMVKTEIQQGYYALHVPAGTYKIRIEGEGFYAEWYEDAHELADAKSLTVTCDEPRVEVNFEVEKMPEPNKFVVTGRVYDAETNEGINNALVVFEARKRDGVTNDPRFMVIKVETNADGMYEARLPEGMFYVASALVRGDRGSERSLYLQEWWEETHDATTATVMEITGNVDGIDFSMDKREVRNNGFGGQQVDDSTGTGIRGKVTAYLLVSKGNSDEQHKVKVVSVETDEEGNFTFTDLEPGDYIVFGVPGERPFVPGWYVEGAVAAHEWKDATVITVGDDMLTGEHTIRFAKAKDGVGRGKCRGWVYDRKGGIIGKGSERVEGVEGIMGSLVIATDASGNVIDFAITENEGAYELLQLGVGTWTVTADRVGFNAASESVIIEENNLDVSTSIGLVKVVSSVEVPTDLVGTSYNLFPNPANTSATISFPSTHGTAQIAIVSTSGVVLGTQNIDVVAGQTNLELNTTNIPMGMVMVRVTNGSTAFALPLQIVR